MATTRKPVAKKRAAKRPAAKRPVAKKPAAKRPAAKKPVAKKPAAKKSAPKKPVARKPKSGAVHAVKRTISRAAGKVLSLAGVGSDAVARATGRAWDQWLAVLDAAGAAAMPHKAIAKLLSDRHGVPPWWSQMVAVGYEQARGLREAYRSGDGFAATASRTMRASVDRLYTAWADPALRALWLGRAPVEVMRSADGKSMRMGWDAGDSRVEVQFVAKGPGKSAVALEHRKLADRRAVLKQKDFWGKALERLKALLEKAA